MKPTQTPQRDLPCICLMFALEVARNVELSWEKQ